MALKYKTRGMSTPQGKPRVYFCCHPEDFSRYFDRLSDQILKLQNCAIWYAEGGEAEERDLEQMQLFVMPVTDRLLNTENHALMLEFPLAIARHIPVLPLLMEGDLDKLFNEKCGDLQFLNPNAQDDTAISFDEKLKIFLDSVLIGDEMAEKIRAAFDAYVFLSYRKKDRKQAQELMRLIHRNDFCRDLAIWYDEFLIPGENFNDAIRDALNKSGLFVLAVTPNLINELNYVMTTEYPMAVEAGKTVLPAEMEETDRGALEEKYENIPPCTDARDEEALSQALLASLRSLALRSNDSDPEHNFFIGLAYLGGVDVEVDHDRALQLITSAANAGLLEAYDKLVEMHRTGMGVERNYLTAIQWQEEKVRRLDADYKEKRDSDSLYAAAQANLYCATLYQEQGDENKEYNFIYAADDMLKDWFWIKEENSWTKRLLRRFQKPKEREPRLLRLLARCYKWYGKRYQSEPDYAEARRLDEELLATETTPEAYRELLTDYDRLGRLNLDQGRLEAAREWYEKGLTLARAMMEEYGTVEARLEYAVSCGSLAQWHKYREDWNAVERWNRERYDIMTALAKETDEPKVRRSLSNAVFCFAEIYEGRDDFSAARTWYERAMAMDEALSEETGLFLDKKRVAVDCYYLGWLCELEEDPDGARRWYERAYALDNELVKASDNADIWYDRCEDAYALGELFRAQGELDAALEWYKKAWPTTRYSTRNKAQERKVELYFARVCRRQGEIYLMQGDYEKADFELVNADRYYGYLRNSGHVSDLREYVEYMTWRCTHTGYRWTNTAYLEQVLEVALPLAKKTGILCDRRNLADVYYELVRDSIERKAFEKAKQWVAQYHGLCRTIAEETGIAEDRRILSIACEKWGDLQKALGEQEGARDWYKKSLEISRALLKQDPTPQAREDVATGCWKLAQVSPKSRTRYLRQAIEIYEQLCQEYPEESSYQKLLKDARHEL